MAPPCEGRISEVPASTRMTCPKSELGPASRQMPSAKVATFRLNSDFAARSMAEKQIQNLSPNGHSYGVFQSKTLEMQDHFFRDLGTFPSNIQLAFTVWENGKTVGKRFRLARRYIGFQNPPKGWPGVFDPYNHLLLQGPVLRNFHLQFFFPDTLLRKQIDRMRQKYLETQAFACLFTKASKCGIDHEP